MSLDDVAFRQYSPNPPGCVSRLNNTVIVRALCLCSNCIQEFIHPEIVWDAVPYAEGYSLSMGTIISLTLTNHLGKLANEIIFQENTTINDLNVLVENELQPSTQYFISITPYNLNGYACI